MVYGAPNTAFLRAIAGGLGTRVGLVPKRAYVVGLQQVGRGSAHPDEQEDRGVAMGFRAAATGVPWTSRRDAPVGRRDPTRRYDSASFAYASLERTARGRARRVCERARRTRQTPRRHGTPFRRGETGSCRGPRWTRIFRVACADLSFNDPGLLPRHVFPPAFVVDRSATADVLSPTAPRPAATRRGRRMSR
jgi:hypothetical protein